MASYKYLNNPRNILLDTIADEFDEEIANDEILINEIGDIPTDYIEFDEKCKMVFYARKISASYEEPYPNYAYEKGTFKIGIRSCEENKGGNIRLSEDYIYRLWNLFRMNDFSACGYLIKVIDEHYLLSKDNLTRYFWEFTVEINNR